MIIGSIPQHHDDSAGTPQHGRPFNYSKVLDTVLIPRVVYRDPTLSPGARLLWGIVRRLAHKSGQCFATDDRLADEMAVSWRQVKRYCHQLVAAGLMRETFQPGRATTRELLWHKRFDSNGNGEQLSDALQANNKRRLSDGNRPTPLTDTSTPTPDESVRGVLTDTSTLNLIGFSSGLLKATLPPPSPEPPPQSPPEKQGGEEREKVKSRDAGLGPPSAVASVEPDAAAPVTHQHRSGKPSPSRELHAGDRAPDQLAIFLRHSFREATDAEIPLLELNSIVRILRANRADHIAYSLHMRHICKTSKKKVGLGMWIKIAATFGQGVTAEQLNAPRLD